MRFRRPLTLLLATLAALVVAAPAAQARPRFFGFNDDWRLAPKTVAVSKRYRANSERVQVYWRDAEPAPGAFNWYGYDFAYRAMLARRVAPLIDVVSAPAWARDLTCNDAVRCPQSPAHDGDYARFLQALVRRYPKAVGIEVSNEPNLHDWWLNPDPVRYTQLLKVAHDAVKHANPRMRVILGATCCTTAHTEGNIGAADFLARVYALGGGGNWDAIGFHLYPGRGTRLVAPDLKYEMARMRAVRNAHRDRSPFWITETGYSSVGYSSYGGGANSLANQALREAITYRVLRNVKDIQALYFYRLTDPRPGEATGVGMGLYTTSARPKPAARSLLAALKAPPWPEYVLSARAPGAAVKSGDTFAVSASGYRGRGGVYYQWVIWRGDHWSAPLATTSQPQAHVHIFVPGRYRLNVRLVTPFDEYLGRSTHVQIVKRHP